MNPGGMTFRQRLVDVASVTAISVFVWLWAAGQTLQTRLIALDVAFESGDPTRIAVRSPGTVHVNLELSGSRQAVLRATESLSGRTLRLVTGADGVPASAGEHEVLLKDVLGISPSVAPLGVDVSSVTPSVVRLVLEPT